MIPTDGTEEKGYWEYRRSIVSAIRSLLSKIIDYAGLFPPASLTLTETLQTFRRLSRESIGWMIGKIVLPSNVLSRIDGEILDQFDRFPVTIVSTNVANRDLWLETLRTDLAQVKPFAVAHRQVVVEAFEVVLPGELDSTALGELLKSTYSILESYPVYFEIPSGPRFDYRFALAGDSLGEFGNSVWGLKLRTGGINREQFPSSRTIADAILVSQHAQIPIKFTAGLHHPIRRWDETLQTEMQGFINVFLGAFLAQAYHLSADSLIRVLEEKDPARFWFRDTSAGWNDLEVARDTIKKFRGSVPSFGSCSVDEPREGLEKLGWIPLA
jgi:hypothetical protein